MKTLFVLAFLATPAFADDFIYFHSPTGNINCALMSGDYAGVRCDMKSFTPNFRNPPADCDLDWGDSFGIGPNERRGSLLCHGDTVIDPGSMELGYGASATLGEFTCTSEKSGMTCTNARGHGFAISKAKQKLF
ncbi:MAG: DUF6636 domain-containing protein [Paracoccaceae bacterium]